MKYCKDCQHYVRRPIGSPFGPYCSRPELLEKSPVHGPLYTGADKNRAHDELCGRAASYFEPKRKRAIWRWLFGAAP
jgi:hypothetical protein